MSVPLNFERLLFSVLAKVGPVEFDVDDFIDGMGSGPKETELVIEPDPANNKVSVWVREPVQDDNA